MRKIRLHPKIIGFILIIIFYFYVFMFEFFRYTVLPTVDRNIAQAIHKNVVITPTTRENCFKAGGEWRKPGPWPIETCMVAYKDGGKVCFAGLMCEARDCMFASGVSTSAIVASGRCPKYQISFGCMQKVHFGITDKGVCLDE